MCVTPCLTSHVPADTSFKEYDELDYGFAEIFAECRSNTMYLDEIHLRSRFKHGWCFFKSDDLMKDFKITPNGRASLTR